VLQGHIQSNLIWNLSAKTKQQISSTVKKTTKLTKLDLRKNL